MWSAEILLLIGLAPGIHQKRACSDEPENIVSSSGTPRSEKEGPHAQHDTARVHIGHGRRSGLATRAARAPQCGAKRPFKNAGQRSTPRFGGMSVFWRRCHPAAIMARAPPPAHLDAAVDQRV